MPPGSKTMPRARSAGSCRIELCQAAPVAALAGAGRVPDGERRPDREPSPRAAQFIVSVAGAPAASVTSLVERRAEALQTTS